VGSVVSYGSLLDLGIGTALIKYVAEHEAEGRMDQARAYVATALRIYVVLGLTVAVVATLAAGQFGALFNIAAEQQPLAAQLVVLIGIGVAIAIPGTTTTAVLRGLQRYQVVGALATLGSIVGASTTVVVLLLGGGVLEL